MAVKIHELRARRAEIVAEMKALHLKDASDEGMSAEEAANFNQLGDTLAEHDKRISRCESMLSAEAEDAKAADSDDDEDDEKSAPVTIGKSFQPSNVLPFGRRVPAEAKPVEVRDGSKAIQMMIAKAFDSLPRKSDDRYKSGYHMIRDNYGESEVTKALMATGTGPNGGYLIPVSYLAELIQYLRSKVVMRQIGHRSIELTTGNLFIPRQSATVTAQWQGEADDIATSVPAFDDITLLAHKLTAMAPVTNDLIRRSPISAEAVLRNDLAMQIARAEDIAFIRGTGANGQPTGLLNRAPAGNVLTATAADANSVLDFLTALTNVVEVANVDLSTGVWLMHPSVKNFLVALRNGLGYPYFEGLSTTMTLLGYPVHCTTQIPTNLTNSGGTAGSEIYFVPGNEVIIADCLSPTIEVSREASFLDVGTTTLISAWSKDLTVFRVINEVDTNVFHPQAVAIGLVNGWTPAV